MCGREWSKKTFSLHMHTHVQQRTYMYTTHKIFNSAWYLIFNKKKQRQDLKDNAQKDDFKILQVYENLFKIFYNCR